MNLRTETQIEVLRQAAVMLDAENRKLHGQLVSLASEVDRLKGQDASTLQMEIAKLREQMDRLQRTTFDKSREDRSTTRDAGSPPGPTAPDADPGSVGGSPEDESFVVTRPERKKHERKPRTVFGRRSQPELPVFTEECELPEDERTCPACGGDIHEIPNADEEATFVDVVERRFIVRRVHRKKYGGCTCGKCLRTAPAPVGARMVDGGGYSTDFAILVAIDKYDLHMPLERIAREMARQGLSTDSNILFSQLYQLSLHLTPTYEALPALIRRAPCVHMDETTWRMLKSKSDRKHYMWEMVSIYGAYFRIRDGRDHAAILEMLGEDWQGALMCDGYGAYETAEALLGYLLGGCWSHIRREFFHAAKNHPDANVMLDLIDAMFAVEAQIAEEVDASDFASILALRTERVVPILNKIDRLRNSELAQRAQLAHADALAHLNGEWRKLVLFSEIPHLPMSNNFGERILRGPVVGRKNHYGSKSVRGTLVAAIMYSLVETARIWNIDPAAYLRAIVHHNLKNPGVPLMPWAFLGKEEPALPPPLPDKFRRTAQLKLPSIDV
jgi:transposase